MNRIILIGKNSTMPRLTGPAYDATAERWIQPPSGMSPDAAGAADLRLVAREDKHASPLSVHSARPAPLPSFPGAGHPEVKP